MFVPGHTDYFCHRLLEGGQEAIAVVCGAPFRNQLNSEPHLYTHSVWVAQPTLSSRRYCGGMGNHCVDDVRDLEISTMASGGSGSLFHLGFYSHRFASSDYISQLEIMAQRRK